MNKLVVILLAVFMLAFTAKSYANNSDSSIQFIPISNKINQAIRAKDMNALAKLFDYPIELKIRDRVVNFTSYEELKAFNISYDDVFSADTQSLLIEDINKNPCCTIIGYRGATIANGIIWFSEEKVYNIVLSANDIPERVEFFCTQDNYNIERWFYAREGFSALDALRDWNVFTDKNGSMINVYSWETMFLAGKQIYLNRKRYSSSRYPEYTSGNLLITFIGEGDSDESTGSSGIKHINKIVVLVKSTNNNYCERYVLYPES